MKKGTYLFYRFLALFLAVFLTIVYFPRYYKTYAGENTCVYVSPSGNDSGSGGKTSPFATLDAAFSKLGDGGTVVIMGELVQDVTVLNASVTGKCKNTSLITVTGKDPDDGTIYDAVLPINSPRLYGPMKIEYLTIAPTRNYAFFNTYGNSLVFGDGIDKKNYDLYIHSGALGNTVIGETSLEINSGSYLAAYIGGAFTTDQAYGVSGNCYFTMNGGSVSNLYLGFDSGAAGQTPGKIDGNIVIRHNGGIINKITARQIKDNSIGGYLAIITRDGLSAHTDLPAAELGTYIINVGSHGAVYETDTAGVFELIPENGYYAYIDGRRVTSQTATVPEGESTVVFSRDTVPADYEGAVMNGFHDGTFRPDSAATRHDLAAAAVRCVTGRTDDDFDTLCAELASRYALPADWDADALAPITKSEAVYVFSTLIDAHCDSVKLFDYADVPDDHPYAEEIYKAAGTGKIPGRVGEQFFPDKTLTRLELSELIAGYLGREPLDGATVSFSDVSIESAGIVAAVSSSREAGKWDFVHKGYVIPSFGGTESYIKALHEQSEELSPDEIRDASDVIAAAVRNDILSTPNTAEIYDFELLGIETVYYVSEKSGNDLNDGLSPETAFKTPAPLHGKIQRCQNTAVLFERGGIYRTGAGTSPLNLAGSKNIVIGSYGTGQKPVVMQSRMNYAEAEWSEVIPNVYRLETKLRNVGVIAFDHDVTDYTEGTFEEVFGEIENMDTQGFTGIHDMNTDLQFYSELEPTYSETETTETVDGVQVTTKVVTESYDRFYDGYLYLYSEHGNPSDRFDSIEIGECYDLVDGAAHGCIIDNISFKFTGAHGIGLATSDNISVQNCIFSWLGGSVLWEAEKVTTTVTRSDGSNPVVTTKLTEATGYGNAVEIYGGCDGFYVCDNWIYQIFDDGITNQYHEEQIDCIQRDMRYMRNLLEYVYHDFSNCNFSDEIIYEKDFPTEGDGAYTDYTADLVVGYNICRMAGYGWGGPMKNRVTNGQMYRSAGLGANKNERVIYNLFDSSGGYIIYTSPNANEIYDSNIYIQSAGTRFIGRMQVGNFPFTANAHRDIISHVGDKNAVTVLVDSDEIKDCRKVTDGGFSFVGAQIRTEGEQALRFIFSVSRDTYEKLSEKELPTSVHDNGIGFGSVVMPKEVISDNKLYKNSAAFVSGRMLRAAVSPAVNIYYETDEEIFFTVCISGIVTERYGTDFVAVPYITYEDEGATVTVYGHSTEGISLFDIAELCYADISNPSESREKIYSEILSAVDSNKYPPV